MSTLTWTGPSGTTASPISGSWNTASNWSGTPQRVPTAGDTAVLGGGSTTYSVTFDATDTIAVLQITDANATLSFNSGKNLTLSGSTSSNAGTIDLNSSTLGHTGSGGFTNTGTINIAGGDLSPGTFTNSSGTISGYGTVVISGSTATTGNINASGGTLDLQAKVSSSTTLTIDSSTTSALKLDYNGSVTIGAVSITNANQTLEIGANSNVTINAAESITNGTIKLDGATLKDTSGITIGSGATLTGYGIIDTGTAVGGTGTITASGGVLEFKGTVDTSTLTAFHIANVAGSDLQFDTTVGAAGNTPTITFDGTSSGVGILDLTKEGRGTSNEPALFHATVSNFLVGDKILVSGHPGDTVSFSDGVLTVKNGTDTEETITLNGTYTSGQFSISEHSSVDTITTTAICFYPGTLVRTPDGEVAVETLRRGDLVTTADGHAKAVSWLGRQTISTVFADPLRVWPIRIKAGALGENVPTRDLRLSPDHAVLVDGALIHAGALVNGTSIMRETTVPRVFVYYHIEVDDHSLILAENTPAETFVDNVDRMNFDNWAEHQALYPQGKSINELPYPRAKAHRQVPVATRVKLGERAQVIGAAADVAAA